MTASNPYPEFGLPVGVQEWEVDCGDIPLWHWAALENGEMELLRDIPRLIGGGNLINIGDFEGGSAILLAQGLKQHNLEGYVYTVDPYNNKKKGIADSYRKQAGVEYRILVLQTKSCCARSFFGDPVGRFWKPRKDYNFVFIDGDHSYSGVYEDCENYMQLLAPGGYLAFHDTNQHATDKVIRTLVEKDWQLKYWVNRIKVFRRR